MDTYREWPIFASMVDGRELSRFGLPVNGSLLWTLAFEMDKGRQTNREAFDKGSGLFVDGFGRCFFGSVRV